MNVTNSAKRYLRKTQLFAILILLITIAINPLIPQTWTEPINISNMAGLDHQPDLCIDKNGTLHCVFVHKIESNWKKIYYTKSEDAGLSWTTPEDISQNSEKWLSQPHISSDTSGVLYVTYDYNAGNPAQTLVYLQTFDGNTWNEPFVVSQDMPNSDYNQVYIDNDNRVYVFWTFLDFDHYYRYYENDTWSDTIQLYPGNHLWGISKAVIDDENNIHCAGFYNPFDGSQYRENVIYFYYDKGHDIWSDKTVLSGETNTVDGIDMDLGIDSYLHIAYRQHVDQSGQNNDSTMYTFYDGMQWTEPELVVNDPHEQRIAVDMDNDAHIIDREKIDEGTKLVHYQKLDNTWQGYVVDSAENLTAFPQLINNNNTLYLVYNKSDIPEETDIYITKYDITTSVKELKPFINSLNIYPNPFTINTNIYFELEKETTINLSVYDLNGKLVKELEDNTWSPGKHQLQWNGTGINGREVINGLYLLRFHHGRKVITRLVELIR